MRLKEAVNGSFKKSPSVQQLELADVEDDVRTKTPKPTVCCGKKSVVSVGKFFCLQKLTAVGAFKVSVLCIIF